MGHSVEILQNSLLLKIELPYDSVILILGNYLKETKMLPWKVYGAPPSSQHYLQQPGHGNNLNK